MFQWATSTFDKLSSTMAPPPQDGPAKFAYCVQRQDEDGAMGAIASIDPIHTVVSSAKGTYPIQLACQYSMVRLIRLLMNQPGAHIAVFDLMGNTPLHYAVTSTAPNALDVCKMLIQEYGASAMSKNNHGQTPYDACSVNSVRQWLLPLQLQAETQYALDNGGVGLPPGIDLGGLRVKNSNLAPPPMFGGASPSPAGGMPPPGGAQQQFGSPSPPAQFGGGPLPPAPYSAGPAPPSQDNMFGTPTPPQPQRLGPIASAPASMPVSMSAPSLASGNREYARSGSSSAAIYSRSSSGIRPDGFHSSSSDVNLQRKYGNNQPATGYGPGPVVAPPPSSGNSVGLAPSSGGSNPFAGGAALGSSNRYGNLPTPGRRYVNVAYGAPGPTNNPAPFTPAPHSGSASPQQTATQYAAPSTPQSNTNMNMNPTSPYMPPPPYQSQNYADPATPHSNYNDNNSHGAPDFMSPAGATYGSPMTPSASIATPIAIFSPPPQAAEPAPGMLPEGWTETVDSSSGQSYYYNAITQETSWERPVLLAKVEDAVKPATELELKVEELPKSVEVEATKPEESLKAADPAPGMLPEGWTETVDPPSGQSYYYNVNTQETSWERPVLAKVEEVIKPATEPELKVEEPPKSVEAEAKPEEKTLTDEAKTTLPEGWTETVDPTSGQSYYYNSNTQETSWERPVPKVEEAAAELAAEPEPMVEEKVEEPSKSAEVEPKPEESEPVLFPAPPSQNGTELFACPPQSSATVDGPPKAADAAPGALPEGWTETADPSTGQSYYYNVNTQETSWERPVAEAVLSTETAAEPDLKVEEPPKSAEPETAETPIAKDESALPDGWTETMDPTSAQSYYYNANTQETSWERPQPVIEAAALPEGWSEVMDSSTGRPYFYNSQTQETSWERPVAPATPEKQSQESGASPSENSATSTNSVESTNGITAHSAEPTSPFAIPQPLGISLGKGAEELFGEDASSESPIQQQPVREPEQPFAFPEPQRAMSADELFGNDKPPSDSPMQQQPVREPEQPFAFPEPNRAMSADELFGNNEPPAQQQQESQQPSRFSEPKLVMSTDELFGTDAPPAKEQEPEQPLVIPEPHRAVSVDELFATDEEPPAQQQPAQDPVQSFGIPEPKRAMSAHEMIGEEPPADSTPPAEKYAAVERVEPTNGAEELLADVSLDDAPPGPVAPDAGTMQNASEPNQEKVADDLDGEEEMLDVPLSPRRLPAAEKGVTPSKATNSTPPMAAQTAPLGVDNSGESLFAAIGMPPPPFSSRR